MSPVNRPRRKKFRGVTEFPEVQIEDDWGKGGKKALDSILFYLYSIFKLKVMKFTATALIPFDGSELITSTSEMTGVEVFYFRHREKSRPD